MMKRIILLGLMVVCFAASISLAETQEASSSKQEEGWLVIEEDIFIPVLDELGHHLFWAKKMFLKGENTFAAYAVRNAADALMRQLHFASPKGKEEIMGAVRDLITLADNLDTGKVSKEKDLDTAFKKALQADQEHLFLVVSAQEWTPAKIKKMKELHLKRAREYFVKGEMKEAANRIRKAIAYMELEAKKAPQESKAAIQASIAELKKLAKEVESGTVKAVEKLDEAIKHAKQTM